MVTRSADVDSLSAAGASLSELAEQMRAGAETERIHLLLAADASKGLSDVAAGKVTDARISLDELARSRAQAR
jgi:hypothetical protein